MYTTTSYNTVHPLNHYINHVLPIKETHSNSTPQRTRITRACDHCQLRKTKCDSAKPRCSQCVKRNDPCTFTTKVCKRGPKPKQHSYPYTSSVDTQVTKSTNVYPYPDYYFQRSNSPQQDREINNTNSSRYSDAFDYRISRYPLPKHQHQFSSCNNHTSIEYNSNSTSELSSNLSSSDHELHRLPPILINPSQLIKSPQINLRLPSLSQKKFRLPSISSLLNSCDDSI
ncbi:hypothetical protein CONCODRAFT_42875 [Conidiobolus coronatus NRRL 28638]|uniref:Zn(2)-C6 fungal-type domain-containing protein n=1 Tax=Conidiobolus coronatus (strain ATCC 28846 / CBS 209.66 / NRRL 28638) TaxID=796925 RepID=A0A137NXK8_CONC2|nr:hypothetical protein CONCODRAFT_42875 [Conidiobolus coronatus NRRL 28638]|eukprot:KXN67422.1 hypothetical protein CONCODRAFT_42875 [Conidiobolus coronatus NRRL 28638]